MNAKWKIATLALGSVVIGMTLQPVAKAWTSDVHRAELEEVRISARLAVQCTDRTNNPDMCLRLNRLEVRP